MLTTFGRKKCKKLAKILFPLRTDLVRVPGLPRPVPQIHVDWRLNALYRHYRAYVTVPFLAWTPNLESTTNVR